MNERPTSGPVLNPERSTTQDAFTMPYFELNASLILAQMVNAASDTPKGGIFADPTLNALILQKIGTAEGSFQDGMFVFEKLVKGLEEVILHRAIALLHVSKTSK